MTVRPRYVSTSYFTLLYLRFVRATPCLIWGQKFKGRVTRHKKCRREILHSCECRLLLVLWRSRSHASVTDLQGSYSHYYMVALVDNSKDLKRLLLNCWLMSGRLMHRCDAMQYARTIYLTLAFTMPKAGRKVRPLNWIQEHKSVWDGPAWKATGHVPGPRAIGPCRCRTTAQREGELANWDRRPLRSPACVDVGTFSKWAILYRFPKFYTLRVKIFPNVFYPLKSTYDRYEPWKVSCKSVRTFFRNPEHRYTDGQTRLLHGGPATVTTR